MPVMATAGRDADMSLYNTCHMPAGRGRSAIDTLVAIGGGLVFAGSLAYFGWQYLHGFDERAYLQDIRGLLGKMLFKGDEGSKNTDALSGGEAVRLMFAKLMLTRDNVLVLDEPTNHLDLESINALNIALQKFEGTVLLVTHDQDLMEEVGTRVWHFDNGTITDHKGSYEEYSAALV